MVRLHELNIIFLVLLIAIRIFKRGIFSRCAIYYSFIITFYAVIRCDEAFLSVGGAFFCLIKLKWLLFGRERV